MADNLTRSPLIIDTTGTKFATGTRLQIKALRWVSKLASAGDDLNLQEGDGRPFYVTVAPGLNYVERDFLPRVVDGLIVNAIDSGTVYLELEG